MLPSWRLALNELQRKPLRSALMVAAVALASSLVAAVTTAIGSVQASVAASLTDLIGAADARIVHQFSGRFDAELLESVRQWPGVELATGRLVADVSVEHPAAIDPLTDRPPRETVGAVGVESAMEGRLRPVQMQSGRAASGPDEVTLDPAVAERLQAGVGDELAAVGPGERLALRVVGLEQPRPANLLQGPVMRMELSSLRAAAAATGELSEIAIILEPGADLDLFCAAHLDELPPALSLEPAVRRRSGFNRRVEASRVGMMIGSVLTFMAASFIILTGMTTGITERQREMAVMRCIGARRRQLFAGQLLAGAALGGGGGLLGIPLGIALGWLFTLIFSQWLTAGVHVVPLGLTLAAIGATVAGIGGAAIPAWLASRTSPLQAMTRGARPPRARSILACAAGGALLVGVQLALIALPGPEQRFWAYAWVGLPALFTGYFLLSVPALLLMTAVVAAPIEALLRLPRGMIAGSVRATPLRHGFTAGALMVGMALLVAQWANGEGLLRDWLGAAKFPDGVLMRLGGITPGQQQHVAELEGVTATCAVSLLQLRVLDRQVFGVEQITPRDVNCIGFEPSTFFTMNEVEWAAGDLESALPGLRAGTGIIVADRFMNARGIGLGDRLRLGRGRVAHEYEIVGVVSSPGLEIAVELFGVRDAYGEISLSCVFMDFATVARHFDNDDAVLMQVDLAPDVTEEKMRQALLEAVPGMRFFGAREIRRSIDEIAWGMLSMQSAVALAALLLACLGVGNVVLANIQARRFEYGVLRAVGAPRSLLARLILAEAGVLAAGGTVVGLLLGMHLAWMGVIQYRELAGLDIPLVIPPLPILIGAAVMLLLTLAAATPGVLMVVRPRPVRLVAGGR